MTNSLTIGERVAWYRRRRGVPQEVLAGRVGRTTDWLSKVENNRLDLDRLSVIRSLADALDVSVGDLIGEPTLLDWNQDSGTRTVPALRAALMDYRQLTPLLAAPASTTEPISLEELRREVGVVFEAYQASKYGFVAGRAPLLLADAVQAAQAYGPEAQGLLALSYQAATSMLTKLGETDLAWIAAERGLAAAQQAGDPVVLGSLFRLVVHALLSNGRFDSAVRLTETAASVLEPEMAHADDNMLSIYGSLFLAGSMAAARSDDRSRTQTLLREAQEAASRQGADGNHMWTASAQRTWLSTVSLPQWSSGTYRSRWTSVPMSTRLDCPLNARFGTRWRPLARLARGTARTKHWRSCSMPSNGHRSRFGTTTSGGNSFSHGCGSNEESRAMRSQDSLSAFGWVEVPRP